MSDTYSGTEIHKRLQKEAAVMQDSLPPHMRTNVFQITGPGFYKTRDGRKAEVEYKSKYPKNKPWVGVIIDGQNWTGAGWNTNGSYDVEDISGLDLIAPWTEPRRRPFTQAEVMKLPADAWIKAKVVSAASRIIYAHREFVLHCIATELKSETYQKLADEFNYTLDGGATWLPFWKEEE